MTFLKKLFRGLSSFGFAVVVLLLLLLLTYLGTLEQVEHGLYETQKKYFESILLVHDFGPWDLRLPSWEGGSFAWSHHPFGPIPIPLPGVYLLLGLLLLNLVCGGIVRLRKDKARAGILVAHLGIVMMLVAGFVKFRWSIDGNMLLWPGQTSDKFQSYFEWEVAIHEAVESGAVTEQVIPSTDWEWAIDDGPVKFTSDALPFDVTLTRFFKNCHVVPKGPMFSGDGPVIEGYTVLKQPLDPEAEKNQAALYATFHDKQSGANVDAILGCDFYADLERRPRRPFTLSMGGKEWVVDFTKKRWQLPFSVHLDKFDFEMHPGTERPKMFMSHVTKSESGVEQSFQISMNEPLRHQGYTLYQASYGPNVPDPTADHYSVLAVVNNPSDQWPKWSCYVIALGLLYHFGSKLVRHVKTENRLAAETMRTRA